MYLRKNQYPILIINIIAIIIFSFIFSTRKNYEFLIYIGVIVFFGFLILSTNKKIRYSNPVLWGLTIWSILHMSGGGLRIKGDILYKLMLFPIIGEPYHILKYDQFVHAFGFAVATLVMYHLIKPHLKQNFKGWISLSIVVVMAGLGAGALNEIVEFIATVIVPDTNVGGYVNTSLDLAFNLIGAIIAMIFIWVKDKKS